jgi:hypothetical protein
LRGGRVVVVVVVVGEEVGAREGNKGGGAARRNYYYLSITHSSAPPSLAMKAFGGVVETKARGGVSAPQSHREAICWGDARADCRMNVVKVIAS